MDVTNDWLRRNLRRGLEWSDGVTKITISDSSGVEVRVYPGGQSQQSIPLLTNHGFDHIHICDLQGAGSETDWHNKRYGTLIVNLLIQAYKVIFPVVEHASIIVKGETHCRLSQNDPGVIEDCKRRSHFWSRFGLSVKHPERRKSPMSCTLADLKMVDRELYPGLNTTLSLSDFRLQVHTPIFIEEDINKLNRIDVYEHEIEDLGKKRKEIREYEDSMYREYRYATMVVSTLIALGLTSIDPFNAHLIKKIMIFMGTAFLSYFVIHRYSPTSWVHRMPSAFSLRRVTKDRENTLEYLESKLNDVIKGDNRFLGRIYGSLKLHLTDLPKNDLFDYVTYFAEKGQVESHDPLLLTAMVLKSKEAIAELNKRRTTEEVTNDDFMFGTVSSMCVSNLKFYASMLGPHFTHHINRLLAKRENNLVRISGTPNDSIGDVLTLLKDDIGRILIYASDVADDTRRFGVKIYLSSGVLDFSRVWCTWKEHYFEYAIDALSVFFSRKCEEDDMLISKVYFAWSLSPSDRPQLAGQNLPDFAKEISDISGSRYGNEFIESCAKKVMSKLQPDQKKVAVEPA